MAVAARLSKWWLPWIVVLLLALAGPLYLDKFTQGLFIQIFTLAIFGMSYDLLLGYSGVVSFGHALFFGMGAYTVGVLLKQWNAPLLAAFLAAVLIAIVLGILVGVLSLRVKGVYFAMVTLAFAEMFWILSGSSELRPLTGGDEGLHGFPVPDWLSPTDQRTTFYYVALVLMILVYLLSRRFVNSPTGRVLLAIRENENRATAIGYNTFAFKLFATVLAGTLAALAGGMNALFFRNATPEVLSVGRTIDALLVTIIGGSGTLLGPILGAGIVRLLGNYLGDWFGPRWPMVFGLIYILLVMFLPYGLIGTWQRQVPAIRKHLVGKTGLVRTVNSEARDGG